MNGLFVAFAKSSKSLDEQDRQRISTGSFLARWLDKHLTKTAVIGLHDQECRGNSWQRASVFDHLRRSEFRQLLGSFRQHRLCEQRIGVMIKRIGPSGRME